MFEQRWPLRWIPFRQFVWFLPPTSQPPLPKSWTLWKISNTIFHVALCVRKIHWSDKTYAILYNVVLRGPTSLFFRRNWSKALWKHAEGIGAEQPRLRAPVLTCYTDERPANKAIGCSTRTVWGKRRFMVLGGCFVSELRLIEVAERLPWNLVQMVPELSLRASG